MSGSMTYKIPTCRSPCLPTCICRRLNRLRTLMALAEACLELPSVWAMPNVVSTPNRLLAGPRPSEAEPRAKTKK
jgi:hypothetical protein